MFRIVFSKSARSKFKRALLIRNLDGDSFYEFRGPPSYLFLALDGLRTIDQAIAQSRKWGKIDKNTAERFYDGLFKEGLLDDVTSCPRKDFRYKDMRAFVRELASGSKSVPLRQSLLGGKMRYVKSDKGIFDSIRGSSDLKRIGTKISFKREKSLFPKSIHIVSARTSIPGRQKFEGQGCSLDLRSAAMAALGESLERAYSFQNDHDLKKLTYEEVIGLNYEALDPLTFKFFDAGQLASITGEVYNPSRKHKMDWAQFEDGKGKPIFLFADLNGNRLDLNKYAFCGESTSNGCAVARDKSAAKLKGALELIERDALLFYWRTKNTPQLIDLSKGHPRLDPILESMGRLKKNIKVFYLRTDLKAIAVQVIYWGDNNNRKPVFMASHAAKLDPIEAVEKALLELVHVISAHPDLGAVHYGRCFDNTVWDFIDHSQLYSSFRAPAAYGFLKSAVKKKVSLEDIGSYCQGDTRKNLDHLISNFDELKLRLYFKDNTPKNLSDENWYVFRAFSPDLLMIDAIHRYAHWGSSRYFNLAKALDLPNKPSCIAHLNHWPHPMP